MNDAPKRSVPRHLWVVGIAALLWNAMGAVDYLMTETKNAAYMGSFTPEQLEYFYSYPAWAISTWAIAVWGGVLGSVLLLLRRRLAFPVFVASFLGLVVTNVYTLILSPGIEMMGGAGGLVFTGVIVLVSILLIVYSNAQAKRGVLV